MVKDLSQAENAAVVLTNEWRTDLAPNRIPDFWSNQSPALSHDGRRRWPDDNDPTWCRSVEPHASCQTLAVARHLQSHASAMVSHTATTGFNAKDFWQNTTFHSD